MLMWLAENLATILICTALAAVVALIIISMIRGKKKGKTSCGCGCTGCPMSGSCHHEK
ncbi:MAG: FeoB-associated Cys-rich membrane protein [Verrucomicrobiae bacterium]|nr:FeoB-associated Cys-rich membrane protein [Verrucomicrobiae bacterium]